MNFLDDHITTIGTGAALLRRRRCGIHSRYSKSVVTFFLRLHFHNNYFLSILRHCKWSPTMRRELSERKYEKQMGNEESGVMTNGDVADGAEDK